MEEADCFPLHQVQTFLSFNTVSVQNSLYENAVHPSYQNACVSQYAVKTGWFSELANQRIFRVLTG
jgi:hypothetical protein